MHITQIGVVALWILAILIPVQLYVGYRMSAKSSHSADQYFIAGKQLPMFMIFMLDFATAMGVGNFVGYMGNGYKIGLNQFWMLFGEQGSKILFALLLAGFIGKFAYTTINEFMEKELFHDKWLRALGGLIMTIPLICTTGAQAIGISSILSVLMGVDVHTGIWVTALAAILYTVMGGMWALAWTDVIQGVIRIVVGFLFFGLVFFGLHGISGIRSSVIAVNPSLWSMSSVGPLAAISLFLAPLVGQFTHQSWWQRCFAAKDSKAARNGFLLTAFFCIAMCSCSILVGIAAFGLNPHLAKPDMAFAFMLQHWMNPMVAALLVVVIIGSDMTLSAGYLNSGVTLLTIDIIKPIFKPDATDIQLIRWARWLTVGLGIGIVWVALTFPSVMSAVLFGYAAAGGGLFMPLMLGMLWRDKNGKTKVTRNAAIASLILGCGTVLVCTFVPNLNKITSGGIVPALCLSLIVAVVISLIEKNKNNTLTQSA